MAPGQIFCPMRLRKESPGWVEDIRFCARIAATMKRRRYFLLLFLPHGPSFFKERNER